jgi:flagellar hook-associated protein FlgK
MTDLIGIGISGLSAYQRALATTSNNVANLQTEGYVRQRAVLASSGQDGGSAISIGTGVRFAEVERLYDRFAEENLQRAGSLLEAEAGLLKELQTLQDAFGSSEAGLQGAFQDFFDSARDVEAAPASAGARAGFLAKAEGLTARFRGLAATTSDLDKGTRAQIEQALQESNTKLSEIATLNKQLLRRGSSSEQPMQLLDQRDNAIRELSKRLGVTAVISDNGTASIYAGESASGIALVENGVSRTITASFDQYDLGKSDFVVDAASRPAVIPGINTGQIGGLVAFRREGLGLAMTKLDELALSFGRTVNALHRSGLDSAGRSGEDLFYVGQKFKVDTRANSGTGRLSVAISNPGVVRANSYEVTYSESSGEIRVRNVQSGGLVKGRTPLEMEGLQLTLEGLPRDGDTFLVTPEVHPAASFMTAIKDGSQVASAGRFAVRSSTGNVGVTAAEISLTQPRESVATRVLTEVLPAPKQPIGEQSFTVDSTVSYQDTLVAARSTPIAVIPAGYSKIALHTAIGEGSELAVFTRDGRQLSGPEMDPDVVRSANGFFAGATYSNKYINRTGSDAYLDRDISRGVFAEGGQQLDVDGNVILTPARVYGEQIVSEAGPQTLIINNNAVPVTLNGQPTTADRVVEGINAARGATGVVARQQAGKLVLSAYNAVRFEVDAVNLAQGDRLSVTIDGGEYQVPYLDGGVTLTRQQATDRLVQLINGAGTGVVATGGIVKTNLGLTISHSADIEGAYTVEADQSLENAGFVVGDLVRITAGNASVGNKNKDLMVVAVSGNTLTCKTVDGSSLTEEADRVACTLVRAVEITNRPAVFGAPITIGANTVGISPKTHFNDRSIQIDLVRGADREAFGSLGFRSGFVMQEALAEDLLVFGVDLRGNATAIALSGTYEAGTPPAELSPNRRTYSLSFGRNDYRLVDTATGTEVASGLFDTNTRTVQYANWSVALQTLPSDGDSFTILPNDDTSGDNRVIAQIAKLQYDRSLLPSNQTVQQEYENLVNRIGVQVVQAEIGRDAQKVVFDQARESRDRVSGVNLDEELSDLLRYQQAYQANAQVIQTASRLFDTLMQRL